MLLLTVHPASKGLKGQHQLASACVTPQLMAPNCPKLKHAHVNAPIQQHLPLLISTPVNDSIDTVQCCTRMLPSWAVGQFVFASYR